MVQTPPNMHTNIGISIKLNYCRKLLETTNTSTDGQEQQIPQKHYQNKGRSTDEDIMAAYAAQRKAEEHARVITGYNDQRHSPAPHAGANVTLAPHRTARTQGPRGQRRQQR